MEEKKKNKTPYIIIIVIIVAIAAGLGGFYYYDKQTNDDLKSVMVEPAKDYYDKYMSANAGSSAYVVTLGMLHEANQNGENYKLNELDKCDKEKTYATINIDYYNGEIKDVEVTLNCKK